MLIRERVLPSAVKQWLDQRTRIAELDRLLNARVANARTEGDVNDALALKQRIKQRLVSIPDHELASAIDDAIREVGLLATKNGSPEIQNLKPNEVNDPTVPAR